MEKIKRYISSAGFYKGSNLEHPDGQLCFYEDHISALKEIFPDWPGEYPKESGHHYVIYNGEMTIADVSIENGNFMLSSDGDWIENVPMKDWGPRVPMWRKV